MYITQERWLWWEDSEKVFSVGRVKGKVLLEAASLGCLCA